MFYPLWAKLRLHWFFAGYVEEGVEMSCWTTNYASGIKEYWEFVTAVDWREPLCIEEMASLVRDVSPGRTAKEWAMEFLNSNDVASHLKETSYRLTYSEAAWIIYSSHRKALAEKICAWALVASEMGEDTEEPRPWGSVWKERFDSIGEALMFFLPRLVNAVDRFFCSEEGEVYQFQILSPRGKEVEEWDATFTAYDRCMRQAESCLADSPAPKRVQIRKRVLDCWDSRGEAMFVDGRLVHLLPAWADDDLNAMEQFFESMWLTIPVPFAKGDVVYNPWTFDCPPLSGGGPIVVEDFAYNVFSGRPIAGFDSFDMSVQGYFQEPDGFIFYEVLPGYLDLELCPEKLLTGSRGIMGDLGKLLRGDIYLDSYTNKCIVSLLNGVRDKFVPLSDAAATWEKDDI